ncbi:glycoprotein-N-acetylgalactosamine 3-beta-galactosyltransferase 1 [Chaetomidium leptoderma]|uniref:N-acetylgalactosaminide beta-1,3-galactosyltransferase n=1 Tax=Chaetomidium leptoderma TaxID=669021 RepID=A0AAN6ZTR4_9PEZI|nr:glycoprotein-N-acetylgalactosamine 3-beta-galactosyltransferase 1 [Chaetomidium leptoderma]
MLLLTRKSSPIIVIIAIVILVLLYTSGSGSGTGAWSDLDEPYYRHDPHRSHHAPQGRFGAGASRPKPPVDPACEAFPDTSKVLLVMKTGASEAFARLPTQLMTMLKCLPDFLVFSDMDQNIGGQQIHDSLSTVLPEAQEGNSDFDLYRRQKWCRVDQENCNKLGNPATEGWKLDKYKNIHMAEKSYAMRPGYDWYLFVDADTYVLWPNLMRWLKKLDPTKSLYLGSVTLINKFRFGHGGSGYLISKAAMESLAGKHRGVANEFDVRAKSECCGDYVFGLALKNKTDVGVQQMWPTINGEKPATLPFGPSHWCHPIVTMHHMNAEEINTFWHFERQRHLAFAKTGKSRLLLIKDIYEAYLAPNLRETREDWDNMADNRFYLDTSPGREWEEWQVKRTKKPEDLNEHEREAHKSFEHCAAACRSLPGDECFRYRYRDGACSTSNSFIMGTPVKKETGDKRTMSGWDVEKINAWIKKQGSCRKAMWPNVES